MLRPVTVARRRFVREKIRDKRMNSARRVFGHISVRARTRANRADTVVRTRDRHASPKRFPAIFPGNGTVYNIYFNGQIDARNWISDGVN